MIDLILRQFYLFKVEGKFQKAETYGLDTGNQEVIVPTDEEAVVVEKVASNEYIDRCLHVLYR